MSIRVMTQVWDRSQHKGSALLVLLAIADHAHDDGGGAFPSIRALAAKVRMSERQTQRLIDTLAQSGELQVTAGGGPRGVHLYRVRLDQLGRTRGDILSPDNLSGVTFLQGGGDISDNEGVTFSSSHIRKEPSLIGIEPSGNRQQQQAAAAGVEQSSVANRSRFDLTTITAYVYETKTHSTNPGGLAQYLHRTGADDADIDAWLDAEQAEVAAWAAQHDESAAIADHAQARYELGHSLTDDEIAAIYQAARLVPQDNYSEDEAALLQIAAELFHNQSNRKEVSLWKQSASSG